MELNKIIFLIIGLLFLTIVPATPSRIPFSPEEPTERRKIIHTIEFSRQSIVVAENEPDAAESGGQTANENRDSAPDSKTADSVKSGNSSDDAAARPIKPFEPSEEIAAEQAVDFPVDI